MTSSMHKPSPRHAWWALALLTATYTFSFVDRQIVNLLVDPIRADFGLSDSQVSFLQGLAFATLCTAEHSGRQNRRSR